MNFKLQTPKSKLQTSEKIQVSRAKLQTGPGASSPTADSMNDARDGCLERFEL
jgi:hypothetical protein